MFDLFDFSDNPDIAKGDIIKSPSGAKVGVLLDHSGSYGIALLRIAEVVGQNHLTLDSGNLVKCYTHIPEWWNTETDEIIKKAVAKMS